MKSVRGIRIFVGFFDLVAVNARFRKSVEKRVFSLLFVTIFFGFSSHPAFAKVVYLKCGSSKIVFDFADSTCTINGNESEAEIGYQFARCTRGNHTEGKLLQLRRISDYTISYKINRETLRFNRYSWTFGSEGWSKSGKCVVKNPDFKF